ncbi:hypothetical protein [Homoserinimonas hongtaonis]|uniref:Uncharacterized protein n=1 Tax=Homoserinimonas hongtaonis TaxID=2079791 RepID=A0A2U1T0U7_9MICO|nr:hypothetical protein [Salinibacterium hongtaonis]AWB90042.1 hypothetical protein C2138_11255 [Salinibacterium hongtaonis]PWB97505.1 hypothetical protein DF220_06415 [Salinibacterium hongtaonis]
MKHLSFGEKSLFIGDEAADALTNYAALLADRGRADTVVLNAIGPDGHTVEATFVLNEGASLMTETADEGFKEPENSDVVEYMNTRALGLLQGERGEPLNEEDAVDFQRFAEG